MVGTGATAQAIVDHAVAAFGRVDILINNAGGSLIGEPDAYSDEEIEGVLRANLIGPYMLLRRVWPLMRAQGYGRIVNTLSSAILGAGHLAPYATGKAGLIGLTADAACDGRACGILVNGILPTGASRLTDSAQADAARWYRTYFQPEKVSAFVADLCSEQASVSGEFFNVGGGRIARLAMVDNDGLFDPAPTPEVVAAGIETIRDMSAPTMIAALWEQTQRFFPICPGPAEKRVCDDRTVGRVGSQSCSGQVSAGVRMSVERHEETLT